MRALIWGALLLLAVGCGRGGDGTRKVNLLISGVDFGSYDGLNVFTALTVLGSSSVPDESSAVISDNGWEVVYRSILTPGVDYTLSYFVDDNQNGLCDEPPDDPGWTKTITDVTTQVNLEVSVSDTQSDPCDPFQSP